MPLKKRFLRSILVISAFLLLLGGFYRALAQISSPVTTFSDGSTAKLINIPPAGEDSTAKILLPREVIINQAKLDVTGGGDLNDLDKWNYYNSCECPPGCDSCWEMVFDAGLGLDVMHMRRASVPLNRRAVTKWVFPDNITIEFKAKGDAVNDIADTTMGFYSNADASSYWGFDLGIGVNKQLFYYINGGCDGCPYGGVCAGPCILGPIGGVTVNNQWYNVKIHINNGNISAKAWDEGTPEPVGWDLAISPGPAAIFGNHIVIGTDYGQDSEEFWFRAIIKKDVTDVKLDVGPNGVVDWQIASLVGTKTVNLSINELTNLISSCLKPVGDDCLLDLKFSSASGGVLELNNLLIIFTIPVCLKGLVPCNRSCDVLDTPWDDRKPCQLCHLFVLLDRLIDFLLVYILFPIAVLMIVIAGVLYIGAVFEILPGGFQTLNQAKGIILSVILGLIIIFVAFVLIGLFLQLIELADWTTNIYKDWWSQGLFEVKCQIK